jgi:hypothetical protein
LPPLTDFLNEWVSYIIDMQVKRFAMDEKMHKKSYYEGRARHGVRADIRRLGSVIGAKVR